MAKLLLFLLMAFAAAPAEAQVRPQPVPEGDPHLQSVKYAPGQVVLLELAPGFQMTIELGSDEQIENVAVGDSGAWQVTANRRGDRLFLKALQAGSPTNMTVVTNARLYAFELAPLFNSAPNMAYVVRFEYPGQEAEDAADAGPVVDGRYRLSGEKTLRPVRISDDGRKTYIEWAKDRPLPAVYSLDDNGKEALVDGMMRDDLYVIDSVSRELVFRIDKKVAHAVRAKPKKGG
jgi:type IV secretion system protein VirB9